MTDDLNLHVEAMRALFKKRFSGGKVVSGGVVSHLEDQMTDDVQRDYSSGLN